MSSTLCPEQKRKAIVEFLQSNTPAGPTYYKSKRIAAALGLSSREVGTNLKKLAEDGVPGLHIEQYAVTKSTTWKVARTATNVTPSGFLFPN